jgi:hypothetical protein
MYKVELTDETVEMIFRDILVEDYIRLCRDIKELEANEGKLESWEREDLENNKYYRKGFKKILRYYLVHGEAEELINRMK